MFGKHEILQRLTALEQRLERIESKLDAAAAEAELRERLADKSAELDEMAQQGLHVVEMLDEARRRIRELEAGGK